MQREQLEVFCLDRSILKFGQVVKFEKGKAEPKYAVFGHRAYFVPFGYVCLLFNYLCCVIYLLVLDLFKLLKIQGTQHGGTVGSIGHPTRLGSRLVQACICVGCLEHILNGQQVIRNQRRSLVLIVQRQSTSSCGAA